MAHIVMAQAIGACIDAARLEFDMPTQNKVCELLAVHFHCGLTMLLTVHITVD